MGHILKSISDFTLDPYALIWFTGKAAFSGNLPCIFMPLVCTGEQYWCPQSSFLLGGARVEEHTGALSQVPTFLMDPCPPSGSSLHIHAKHLGKAADKKLHCNKHNVDIRSRMVMDFTKLNVPSSLFMFHQDMAFLLRLGLSHGTETITKIPNCVPSE